MNAMKQCLRCGNFCTGASKFCQSCQSSLLNRFEQKSFQTEPMPCPETRVLLETRSILQKDKIDSGQLAQRPLPWVRHRASLRRASRIFIAFLLLIIVVLIADGVLASLVFTRPSHIAGRGDSVLLLTLMPD